jgi:hypothetical protein
MAEETCSSPPPSPETGRVEQQVPIQYNISLNIILTAINLKD